MIILIDDCWGKQGKKERRFFLFATEADAAAASQMKVWNWHHRAYACIGFEIATRTFYIDHLSGGINSTSLLRRLVLQHLGIRINGESTFASESDEMMFTLKFIK